ncbi:MAG: hypothetical protein H7A51_19360 [Akkermansiaceae bacterium]|nr:hypothetical protein [Akkermansiaceae bacterium]
MKTIPSNNSSESPTPRKPRKAWIKFIPLLLVFGALVTPLIVGLLDPDRGSRNRKDVNGVNWNESSEKVIQSLEKAKSDAELAEKKIWEEFAVEIADAQKTNREDTHAGVNTAVSNLVKTSEIGWLITDYAQDKVRSGDRAKKRIEARSKNFTKSLKASSVRVDGLLNALQHDLTAVNNRYAIAVGHIIEQNKATLPKSNFDHLAQVYEKVPFDVTLEVGVAGTATGIELVTVRGTRESVKVVYKYLRSKLAPQIAKAATGAGTALADGPLPFGDIITVGLAIWTIYDVATLPRAIRGGVHKEFKQAADEHLRILDSRVDTTVQKLAKQSLQSRENAHSELLTALR